MSGNEAHWLKNIGGKVGSVFRYLPKFLDSFRENDENCNDKRNKYYILNQKSRLCIDVKDCDDYEGASIQQWSYDGTLHKLWLLEPLEDDYWCIISLSNGLCIETNNGVDINLSKFNDKPSQKWKLNELHGAVKITPKGFPKTCIGVEEGRTDNGAKIIVRVWDGEPESTTVWLFVVADFQSLRKPR